MQTRFALHTPFGEHVPDQESHRHAAGRRDAKKLVVDPGQTRALGGGADHDQVGERLGLQQLHRGRTGHRPDDRLDPGLFEPAQPLKNVALPVPVADRDQFDRVPQNPAGGIHLLDGQRRAVAARLAEHAPAPGEFSEEADAHHFVPLGDRGQYKERTEQNCEVTWA